MRWPTRGTILGRSRLTSGTGISSTRCLHRDVADPVHSDAHYTPWTAACTKSLASFRCPRTCGGSSCFSNCFSKSSILFAIVINLLICFLVICAVSDVFGSTNCLVGLLRDEEVVKTL